MTEDSIFKKYFVIPSVLEDMLLDNNGYDGVDVIIPIINTNELFERNLYSFYKEIPIKNLLIGDGGCTDESIKILEKFPRVKIIDHTKMISQGGSILDLIKQVKSENFIYLHADAFLPEGWFNKMKIKLVDYDWFECPQKLTTMIEFWNVKAERSYSGAQMGKRIFFNKIISIIDDDYLQRNEDIILAELVQSNGGKYGKNEDVFHYHQVMNRRGESEPKFKKVIVEKNSDIDWESRIYTMQYKGIIKYLNPNKKYLIDEVNNSLIILNDLNVLDIKELKKWIRDTNSSWLPFIKYKRNLLQRLILIAKNILNN